MAFPWLTSGVTCRVAMHVVQVVHYATVPGQGVGARSTCPAVNPGMHSIHPEEVLFSKLHKSSIANSSPNNSLFQAGPRMHVFRISSEIKYQGTKRKRPKFSLFSPKEPSATFSQCLLYFSAIQTGGIFSKV